MFPVLFGWLAIWHVMFPVTVLIDPGHGGTNYGAQALDGSWEKDLTLDTALRLERALSRLSVHTALTRRTDESVSLWRRADMARRLKPACFVSLHFNASVLKNRQGIEIFHPREDLARSVESMARVKNGQEPLVGSYLADLQLDALSLGSRNLARRLAWRLDADGFRVAQVAPASFDMIAGADTRTILVEGGFLDHDVEGTRLLDPEYREKLAQTLAVHLAKLCGASMEESLTW